MPLAFYDQLLRHRKPARIMPIIFSCEPPPAASRWRKTQELKSLSNVELDANVEVLL